ncbi:MAG: ComF family protein [Ruminococcaceae bacterium]|nr:ComF family protein [Oscillospiraceae bacterium]
MKDKKRIPILDRFAAVLSYLLRLLFPPKCAVCGDLLLKEGELCPECLALWESARREKCPVCQKTARGCTCRTFHMLDTDMIGERRMTALAFYERFGSEKARDKAVLRLVYAVKTSDDRAAVRLCARELSAQILRTMMLDGEKPEEWKITYPPRSSSRKKKYGFDHGRVLSQLISRYTGIELENTLENTGERAQKSLNSLERMENAESSYRLREGVVPKGKYIIADDIITTGATVNTAAKILKRGGAEEVYPVCIARAKKKKRKLRRPSDRPWFKSK